MLTRMQRDRKPRPLGDPPDLVDELPCRGELAPLVEDPRVVVENGNGEHGLPEPPREGERVVEELVGHAARTVQAREQGEHHGVVDAQVCRRPLVEELVGGLGLGEGGGPLAQLVEAGGEERPGPPKGHAVARFACLIADLAENRHRCEGASRTRTGVRLHETGTAGEGREPGARRLVLERLRGRDDAREVRVELDLEARDLYLGRGRPARVVPGDVPIVPQGVGRHVRPVELSAVARSEREVERKFVVADGFVLPGLDVPGLRARPLGVERLRSTYLDTPDLRLLRAGVTLRRRSGTETGWQLKLPVLPVLGPGGAGAAVRDELHAPDARAVPEELARLVRGVAGGRPLGVVATLDTTRRAVALHAADGGLAGLVVDDEVAYTAGTRSGRFREVEVEDHGGGALLAAVGKRLVAAGARPGTGEPKLARALGPLVVPATGTGTGGEPGEGSVSAGAVAAALVRERTDALLRLDIAVRRGCPDALHQFRVACRRLRTLLGALGGVLADPLHETPRPTRPSPPGVVPGRAGDGAAPVRPLELEALVEELRWVAGELGAARDLEVVESRVLSAADELPADLAAPARAVLEPALARARVAVERRAASAMEEPRYFALLDALVLRGDVPPAGAEAALPAAVVFGPLVSESWRRFARRVRAARQAPPTSAEEAARLHRARVAAKRVRYLAEAFEPVLGPPARAVRRAAVEAQDVLGRHHDAIAGTSVLRSLAGLPDEGGEVVAGLPGAGPAGAAGATAAAPEEPLRCFSLGAVAGVLARQAAEDRDAFLRRWPTMRRRARRAARRLEE